MPLTGRVLPGMPLETTDPDGDEEPRASKVRSGVRFASHRGSLLRPAGAVGRVFLSLGALTVVGGLVAVSIFLSDYLKSDSRYRIAGTSNIEASGLSEVSRAEMLPIFGADIGRNIFFVNLNDRRKQLEELPWVEHATVMRLLPDHIRVEIVERQPVAFVRQGQQIGLVDANGVLLTMPAAMMAQHHYSFPVVTGLDAQMPPTARRQRMEVYQRLLSELDANGQRLSEQISEIDLSDAEDARVLMPEQGADILAHFGEDHFYDRYQRYKAHISEWRQQYPKLAAVDLRYDQQVVLDMNPAMNPAMPPADQAQATTVTSAAQNAPAPASASDSTPSALNQTAEAHAAPAVAHDAPKTTASLKQASQKTSSHKVTEQAKNVKTVTRPDAKSKLKAKNAKTKSEKKHAETKRAALNIGNVGKKKIASTTRTTEATRQGQ